LDDFEQDFAFRPTLYRKGQRYEITVNFCPSSTFRSLNVIGRTHNVKTVLVQAFSSRPTRDGVNEKNYSWRWQSLYWIL